MPREAIADRVDGIVHEETQVHEYGIDLTVSGVDEVAERGHLDFDGDKFADADRRPLASALRDPTSDRRKRGVLFPQVFASRAEPEVPHTM